MLKNYFYNAENDFIFKEAEKMFKEEIETAFYSGQFYNKQFNSEFYFNEEFKNENL
jgi:hypothetical protein